MKIKKFKKIIIFCIIIIQIMFLAGCSTKKTDKNVDLKHKAIEELNYIDLEITDLINGLNNISLENYKVSTKEISLKDTSESVTRALESSSKSESSSGGQGGSSSENTSSGGSGSSGGQGGGSNENSSDGGSSGGKNSSKSQSIQVTEMISKNILTDDKKPKWTELKVKIENMYNVWNSIIIDLYALNIPSENILNFSKLLDESTISIKKEDKSASLKSLTELYKIIPEYLTHFSTDTVLCDLKNTKYHVFAGYGLIDSDKWQDVEKELDLAAESFTKIMENADYLKTKEYYVNKIYVLLMELKSSVALNDKDVFYIKYKNVIEEINLLQ